MRNYDLSVGDWKKRKESFEKRYRFKNRKKRSRREIKTYYEGHAETNWKTLICNNKKIKWEHNEKLRVENLRWIGQRLERQKAIKMRKNLE